MARYQLTVIFDDAEESNARLHLIDTIKFAAPYMVDNVDVSLKEI